MKVFIIFLVVVAAVLFGAHAGGIIDLGSLTAVSVETPAAAEPAAPEAPAEAPAPEAPATTTTQ